MEIINVTNCSIFNYFASIGLWASLVFAPIVIIINMLKD